MCTKSPALVMVVKAFFGNIKFSDTITEESGRDRLKIEDRGRYESSGQSLQVVVAIVCTLQTVYLCWGRV